MTENDHDFPSKPYTPLRSSTRSNGRVPPLDPYPAIPALAAVNCWTVEDQSAITVERRAARAILIDDQGRLLLIKRSKPGQESYWTTPGGGVQDSDRSIEAALYRELSEELGAQAVGASEVFQFSAPSGVGIAVQHFFVARLTTLDESARSGPEFSDPSQGGYDLDRNDLRGGELSSINLKPTALKEFIQANLETLLADTVTSGRSQLEPCIDSAVPPRPGQWGN